MEEVLSSYDWAALVATIWALVDEHDVYRDQRRIRGTHPESTAGRDAGPGGSEDLV